jgi:hypothetical protein
MTRPYPKFILTINDIELYYLSENKSIPATAIIRDYFWNSEFGYWGLKSFSANPYAAEIAEQNIKHTNWTSYFNNPGAKLSLIEKMCDKESIDNSSTFICTRQGAEYFRKRLNKNPNETITYQNLTKIARCPYAIDIIENHLDLFSTHWHDIALNPNAIHLLEKRIKSPINDVKRFWGNLSKNPNAIKLLEENKKYINWEEIGLNPNAVEFIEKHFLEIPICQLKNLTTNLSKNENAISFLKKNRNHINYIALAQNKNQGAIDILESHMDRILTLFKDKDITIIFNHLSENDNPNAIRLLEKYPKYINMLRIYRNPNATHWFCRLDYEYMFKTNKEFKHELTKKVFDPRRLEKICEIYGIELIDYIDMYME